MGTMNNSERILADREQIKNLIPQRSPMLLIDQLIRADESFESFVTSFSVPYEHVFVEGQKLREPGLIENLAQSAATGIGYKHSLEEASPDNEASPNIGYIGAIKNLTIEKCPDVGQQIQTTITVLHEIFDVVQVRGELRVDDTFLAKGDMKVFHSSQEDN